MRTKPQTALLSIAWGDRYTRPPPGRPRILWEKRVEWTGQEVKTIARPIYDQLGCFPGCGYALCLSIDSPKGKTWSKETKARVRRLRLKKRLERRVPLLAGLLYEQELRQRPDYFAGA